jgi:LmbE family N-acetylglucosaminyl deacetylase
VAADPQVEEPDGPADLDVLYVGAHPDDEASRLSTFGEWRERYGADVGVVTITRGEGGGNAVGPEEGPPLGLIREREERDAVGTAGLTDVYNLDKVDFYYSVSAPLHQRAWGQEETLSRLVRVIRETTPEVLMTMNPAPSPGNHGGHQDAALLLIEAYYAAGDPSRFPEQITEEGLEPFAPKRLFTTQARGQAGSVGQACATSFRPVNPAEDIYGVWSGRRAENGKTWAQIEREAQRKYASQGWAGFPDVSADPASLPCDYMMQIDARVPFTRGDSSEDAAPSSSMLEGALLQQPGGFPLGTGLDLTTQDFRIVPGGSSTLAVSLTAPEDRDLRGVRMDTEMPDGWRGPKTLGVGRVPAGQTVTRSFEVTAPASESPSRQLVGLTVTAGNQSGFTDQQLEVVPAVQGTQQLLPQVAEFHRWAERVGVEQLAGIVKPVLTLPSGGSRVVTVDVHNHDDQPHSGEVELVLPDGFSSDGPAQFENVAPRDTVSVDVDVTNTDASLPTSNQGGVNGDYDHTIRTTSDGATSGTAAALELVPTATLPDGTAPELDGTITEGEYGARIDLGRRWEGASCADEQDCSATGWIARSGDALYVAADVTDDTLGTVLEHADCKRHWRVDSLEVAVDPTGTSENTSTTFKAAVLPTTQGEVACAARDADNRQGPIGTFEQVGGDGTPQLDPQNTAPGLEAVSRLKEPYTGYVIEAKIPMDVLPATIDPDRMAFNAFVYDSDTQDKTGQTRIGWSTWGGVQGDPYRWGRVVLEGAAPPEVPTSEPRLDFPALRSVESPQSIVQALRTTVALSGLPATPDAQAAKVVEARTTSDGVEVVIDSRGTGTAHLFAVRDEGAVVLGRAVREIGPGQHRVAIPVAGSPQRVLMAFDSDAGGTSVSAAEPR